ncbi:hypothetical protein TWF730_004572 [Orbilia blumenaviensis]|uniref:Transcription factor IIIC putative zinc-finger domain-containing protein n=1 Tax=Orbilia blumenaviensis TaxID=1796055 RepID=A0AAV9TYU2_9PEZI
MDGIYVQKMVLRRVGRKLSLWCGPPSLVSPAILPGYQPRAILWYDNLYVIDGLLPEALMVAICHDGVEILGVALHEQVHAHIQRQFKVPMDLPASLAGYAFSDPLWKNYLDLNICSTNGALSIFRIDVFDLAKSVLYKATVPDFQGRKIVHNDPEFPHPAMWQQDFIDILDEKRDAFIEEWKIMQATCQVYGMAYLPLGGILSVCYRMKPEGLLEYPIKERERCTLSWQFCRNWSDMFDTARAVGTVKPFTLHRVLGEAIVSDIRFLVDPDDIEDSYSVMDETIAEGLKEIDARPEFEEPPRVGEPLRWQYTESIDLSNSIATSLFGSNEAVLGRARNLLSLLKANKIAPKKPSFLVSQPAIIKLIIRTILEIPVFRGSQLRTEASRRVIWLVATLGIIAYYRNPRIFELAVMFFETAPKRFRRTAPQELAIIRERKAVLKDPGNLDLLAKMTKSIDMRHALETCTICLAGVPLGDLMNARCGNGHLFKRCALTFLIITDPNPRVCAICSREYVSKKMVEGDEQMPHNHDEEASYMDMDNVREPTLLRILYEAVDTCVFCGGSFYDKEARKAGET